MIELIVHGIPAPQGSKTPWGSESNPRTRPWRAAVAAEAAQAMNGRPLLTGPVTLEVFFFYPRPKRHYRSGARADELRLDAPVYHAGKPDLDKTLRAIGDSLTGTVLRDDAQIARVIATKLYGEPACARILVRPCPDVA